MIFQTFLQSNKWQHKDPNVRLEAIAELHHGFDPSDTGADDAGKILADMATGDKEMAVRLAAIAHVRDVAVLQTLQADSDADIANAALMQYCRVVSGAVPSHLNASERSALMQQMADKPALLAVLHECGCDETGLATLARLQSEFALDEQGLLDIAAHSNNHTVRHAAALQIETPALLEQLEAAVRHKDKAVTKLCKDRLHLLREAEAKIAANAALALQLCESIESLASKVIGALSQAQYEYKLSQWQDVSGEADAALTARFSQACAALETKLQEHVQQQQQSALQQQQFVDLAAACAASEAALLALQAPLNDAQIDHLEQQHHALEALRRDSQADSGDDQSVLTTAATLLAQLSATIRVHHALETKRADLDALQEQLSRLTAKNTVGVANAARQLHKLFQKQAWPEGLPVSELYTQCLALEASLERLQKRNQAYLEKLHADSLSNIAALEKHIEEGQVNEAQRMWDKVLGAIKNADEDLQKTLHELLAPYKPRMSELIDWKNFATATKKKELIEHMQALVDSSMHAADRSKKIKALQEEWKNLGHSVQNDALWAQFNKAAQKAFEPCKEYFKERKTKLHSNLEERIKICVQLEELAASLTQDSLNIASLNKIESKAIEDWKLYAPVEQAKIKKLQKRFNDALGLLRQFKRKELQDNAAQKLTLIAEAEKLDALESVQDAMSEAKKLQAQWKTIGPSSFKEDRNHWNAFRAACDKVFNKRKSEAESRPRGAKTATAESPAVLAAKETLRGLRDLVNRSSEELVSSRRDFQELEARFEQQLKEDIKHERRALQEQFDKLSQQYQSKLKAAPDKKSLQLIGQAKSKAEFLEVLELAVLAGKAGDADMDALHEQWQALGRVSDLKQEQALEQRFQSLYQHIDKAALKRQAKDNDEKARELCIAAEILAGIDTPEADKALRMQVQLKQLKQSFGSRESKSAAQQLSDLEVQLLCLGPLEAAARKSCVQRLDQARAKL